MRDLKKDLEVIQAATPEPWEVFDVDGYKMGIFSDRANVLGIDVKEHYSGEEYQGVYVSLKVSPSDMRLILEARNGGWEEAIRRAMAAETEVKGLKANLLMYIDKALHAALSTLRPGMPCDKWTLHEVGMKAARKALETEILKDGEQA